MDAAARAAPRCKCCGGQTVPFGTVDAARTCEDRRAGPVFPPAGIAVPYWRCRGCGFVFACAFDGLDDAGMAQRIYNAEYELADPDFAEARPRFFADLLTPRLAPLCDSMTALDFGGGRGLLAALMRARGFRYDSVDPYFAAVPPEHRGFDLVTAFEVVEHSRSPIQTFRDALAWAGEDGVLLFSTLLLPPACDQGWWYIAPRNGHVSLHTDRSLAACARACGRTVFSLSAGMHLFLPREPNAIARALAGEEVDAALYAASLRGLGAFVGTARVAARFGPGGRRAAASPRHALRAALRAIGAIRPEAW